MSKARLLSPVLLLMAACLPVSRCQATSLSIEIGGIEKTGGRVFVLIFDREAGFPTDPTAESRRFVIPVVDGKVSLTVPGVSAGSYAIAAFLDGNGNNILDKGPFGCPLEPYGFSRNARGWFGPPSFDEAAFRVDGLDKTVTQKFKLK